MSAPKWEALKTALSYEDPYRGPNAWVLDAADLGRFLTTRYFGVNVKRPVVAELLAAFNLTDDLGALAIGDTVKKTEGEPPTSFAKFVPTDAKEVARTLINGRPVLIENSVYDRCALFDLGEGGRVAVNEQFVRALSDAGATTWFADGPVNCMRCEDDAGELVGIVMPVRLS